MPVETAQRQTLTTTQDLRWKYKQIAGVAVSLGLSLLVTALIGGWWASNGAIGSHPEWRIDYGIPDPARIPSKRLSFRSNDGLRLSGLLLKPAGAAVGCVIVAHGSQGNSTSMLNQTEFLAEHGFQVLLVDLRAHGQSGGTYMTGGRREADDVLGAMQYMRRIEPGTPIILLGYSYGADAVLYAAAESAVAPTAIIADSAYVSFHDLLRHAARRALVDRNAPLSLRLRAMFLAAPMIGKVGFTLFRLRTGVTIDADKSLLDLMRHISVPVEFIAADRDPYAPSSNTRKFFAAAASKVKRLSILPGDDHGTYFDTPIAYEAEVLSFLSSVPALKQ